VATIDYGGTQYVLQDGESVLDGLLRQGAEVPHSCRKGSCHACVLQAMAGDIPAEAQDGLKETLRAQGYFKACCCRPAGDLAIALADPDDRVAASLTRIEWVSPTVIRVRLTPSPPIEYHPGQFVTLVREDGLARSYSIASLPEESALELHVRCLPKGRMSQWLAREARPGTWVQLGRASGDCFYLPGDPEQPLLLAGTGTGLAPLYGIARDALAQGHTGPVWLFHGAGDRHGLYLEDALAALSERHENFFYVPSVRRGPAPPGIEIGELGDGIRSAFPSLRGWKAYVCGNPEIVSTLRKQLFMAGVASRAIHFDSFLPAAA
jgi:ferredoxin-NADP reductase